MASNRYGEDDLLEYNPRYKLLICRRCQYAIQKNALDSHLLRHKIYRGDRQDLLSSVAHLDLLEPQNVPLPVPGSAPIEALPILSGYRCTITGCQHLTVSSKRMRRHWSETHGLDGSISISPSLAREVKLQTFFRGTKVRYFEVATPSAQDSNHDNDSNDDRDDDCEGSEDEVNANSAVSAVVPPPPPTPPQQQTNADVPPEISNYASPTDFNLETLSYFHHFSSETSLTLPSPDMSHYSGNYWQVHVIPQALQRHWLMCGLLAVSAHHLAVLTEDLMVKKSHKKWMIQFSSEFFTELEQISGRTYDFESAIVEAEPQRIGEQIRFLLQCARWTMPRFMNELEYVAHSRLSLFMSIVRGCVVPDSSMHYSDITAQSNNGRDDSFMQSLDPTGPSFIRPVQPDAQTNNTPSAVVDRLRMLPFRLAERVGRPESVKDVLATMTAVTAMVKCSEAAFACNEGPAMWQCIATWSTDIPDHFNQMVLRHHPAALVTLAHWARILVLRAEQAGCWFLRGLSEEIMISISTTLSNSDVRVLDLIDNFDDLGGN